jgi:hypothetical protein
MKTVVSNESKSGVVLLESVVCLRFNSSIFNILFSWLNNLFIGYNVEVVDASRLKFSSKGLWFFNIQLPLPNFCLIQSNWEERQTKEGWTFDGEIKLPILLGSQRLMKYSGNFVVHK